MSVVTNFVKTAAQLRGLAFGGKIDELLDGGLAPKTLNYVYGLDSNHMMNSLCGNAISIFGGQAIFIDAANCFDPYLIVKECNLKKNDSEAAERLLRSIQLSRAFTCYQLEDLVVSQLPKMLAERGKDFCAVLVSGVDGAFDAQDNTKKEIRRIEFRISASLQKVANGSGVLYTVVSSKKPCESLYAKSELAIRFYQSRNGAKKALLSKHYARQRSEIEL